MEAAGVRSDLHLYPGQSHGFFNYGKSNDGKAPVLYYTATVLVTDAFSVCK